MDDQEGPWMNHVSSLFEGTCGGSDREEQPKVREGAAELKDGEREERDAARTQRDERQGLGPRRPCER